MDMKTLNKTRVLRFRVTEIEQENIRKYCTNSGVTISDLFRTRIIENRPDRPKWLNERLHSIERDIMGMANNFNQLAKAFNSTTDEQVRTMRMQITSEILKTARDILKELQR